MTDIVQRLLTGADKDTEIAELRKEAADEIVRLRGYLDPLVNEILNRKPYRRRELYRLATLANLRNYHEVSSL